MAHPSITIAGNLTSPVELSFTPSGVAVAKLTVATNERHRNQDTGEWEDRGEAGFWDIEIWRADAEPVANQNWPKGTPVRVEGTIRQRRYETKNGDKRTAHTITAASITHDVLAARRRSSHGAQPAGSHQNSQADPWPAPDPWAADPQ